MKRVSTLVLAALVAIAAPAFAGQTQTEQFDRTIPFASGGRLKLKNFSGDVRITPGTGNQVVIHAVRRATRDRLANIKLDVQVNGSTIEITANRAESGWRDRDNNVVDTTFDIQVPSHTDLELDVFSSDVNVTGIEGRQKLHSFSGTFTLRDVTGPIDADTFSGDVDLDVSRAGSVPDLDIETFSGDVKARIPEGGSARVEFNGFGGEFDTDLPLTYRGGSRRNIKAELGGGGDTRLRFKTFGGSVRLMK